jgi:hypothetical protein
MWNLRLRNLLANCLITWSKLKTKLKGEGWTWRSSKLGGYVPSMNYIYSSDYSLDAHLVTEDSVMRVASRLARTMGPPLNWTAGAPLRGHHPPYPTEDLMRASLLFQKMNLAHKAEAMDISHTQQISANPAIPITNQRRSSGGPDTLNFDILDLDLNPDLL